MMMMMMMTMMMIMMMMMMVDDDNDDDDHLEQSHWEMEGSEGRAGAFTCKYQISDNFDHYDDPKDHRGPRP